MILGTNGKRERAKERKKETTAAAAPVGKKSRRRRWTETHFRSPVGDSVFFAYLLKQTGVPIERFGSQYFRSIVGLSLIGGQCCSASD